MAGGGLIPPGAGQTVACEAIQVVYFFFWIGGFESTLGSERLFAQPRSYCPLLRNTSLAEASPSRPRFLDLTYTVGVLTHLGRLPISTPYTTI